MFSREHERYAKDANVEKMAKSNICILGSKRSPNMCGGLSIHKLHIVCGDSSNVCGSHFY